MLLTKQVVNARKYPNAVGLKRAKLNNESHTKYQ